MVWVCRTGPSEKSACAYSVGGGAWPGPQDLDLPPKKYRQTIKVVNLSLKVVMHHFCGATAQAEHTAWTGLTRGSGGPPTPRWGRGRSGCKKRAACVQNGMAAADRKGPGRCKQLTSLESILHLPYTLVILTYADRQLRALAVCFFRVAFLMWRRAASGEGGRRS